MNRKEFLEKLGLGAAFVLTASCMGGCTRDEADPPRDIDFMIDLTSADNAALAELGSFVIVDNIVIARSNTGDYLAATVVCSHQNLSQITYSQDQGAWLCTAHGALFDEDGVGLNANGSRGLTIYNTSLEGDQLRVFS